MSIENPSAESKEQKFKYFPDPEQRRALVERTLELIYKIKEENIQYLLFLDKGARPLVTIFQDFWKKVNPDAPLPKISFLQIGRETKEMFNLEQLLDHQGGLDLRHVSDEDLAQLDFDCIKTVYGEEIERVRKEYAYLKELDRARSKDLARAEEKFGRPIQEVYYRIPWRKILIVDDASTANETQRLAEKILRAAFPTVGEYGQYQIKHFIFSTNFEGDSPDRLFYKQGEGTASP